MAAKYFKDKKGWNFQKIIDNTVTTIGIYPISGNCTIDHAKFSYTVVKNSTDIPIRSTAREFQEAYLRAKTALDEIVSAE